MIITFRDLRTLSFAQIADMLFLGWKTQYPRLRGWVKAITSPNLRNSFGSTRWLGALWCRRLNISDVDQFFFRLGSSAHTSCVLYWSDLTKMFFLGVTEQRLFFTSSRGISGKHIRPCLPTWFCAIRFALISPLIWASGGVSLAPCFKRTKFGSHTLVFFQIAPPAFGCR